MRVVFVVVFSVSAAWYFATALVDRCRKNEVTAFGGFILAQICAALAAWVWGL